MKDKKIVLARWFILISLLVGVFTLGYTNGQKSRQDEIDSLQETAYKWEGVSRAFLYQYQTYGVEYDMIGGVGVLVNPEGAENLESIIDFIQRN